MSSWQQAGTRIQAKGHDGSTYGTSVILPVDTLMVGLLPYRPEGSTQQELYDGRVVYLEEEYGYRMSIEYAFERTEYRPSVFDTIKDLISLWHNNQFVDFFVKYENGSYSNIGTNPGVLADYKCPEMVPDITEDVGMVEFQNQVRTKQRSLELRSRYNNKSYSEVNWILD